MGNFALNTLALMIYSGGYC